MTNQLTTEQRLNNFFYEYVWIWSRFIEHFMHIDAEFFVKSFNSLINYVHPNSLSSSTLSQNHKNSKWNKIKSNFWELK